MRRVTLKDILDPVRDRSYEISEYFHPCPSGLWLDDLNIDEEFVKRLTQWALETDPSLAKVYGKRVDVLERDIKEIVAISVRQKLRSERLPQLRRLVKRVRQLNLAESKPYAACSIEHTLGDVECALSQPLDVLVKDDASEGILRRYPNGERLNLKKVMRFRNVYEGIVSQLEEAGYPTATMRTLRDTLKKGVKTCHAHDRFSVLQAHLLYNGRNALFDFFALAPEWMHRSHGYELDRATLDTLCAQVRTVKELAEYPSDHARAVLRSNFRLGLSPDGAHTDPFPASVRPFYEKPLNRRKWRWCGLAGIIRSLDHDVFGRPPEEEVARELPALLQTLGLTRVLESVPLKYVQGRIVALNFSDTPNLLDNDPFDLRMLPGAYKLHQRASRKISKLFANARIPEFTDFARDVSLNYRLSELRWFLKSYNPRAFGADYQHPLLIELVERASPGVFMPGFGHRDGIPQLAKYIPRLSAMQGILPAEHFNGLLDFVADHYHNSYADLLFGLLAKPHVWKKYGDNEERLKKLVELAQSGDTSEYGVDVHAAHKEKSIEVLKQLKDPVSWHRLKVDLPYGKQFLEGFRSTPHMTYRMFRTIALEPAFAAFVFGLIKEIGGDPNEDKDFSYEDRPWRPLEAFAYYLALEERLSGKIEEQRVATERETLLELRGQLQKIGGEHPMAEEMRTRRMEKVNTTVCKQIDRGLRLAWDKGYALGLKQITGAEYSEIPDDVKFATGLYFLTPQEDLKQHLKDLILARLDGKQYHYKTHPSNVAFIDYIVRQEIDVEPWLEGMERSYRVKSKGEEDRQENIRWYEKEITRICAKHGIAKRSLHESYNAALANISDTSVLTDLKTQMDAIEELRGKRSENEAANIRIYIETDPMKVLQMGHVVRGSCLDIGGGNEYSTIANAVEANKRVLYAEANGKIVGRKLIAISDEGHIVQFRTYYASDFALDEPFEQFIADLGSRMGGQLAQYGNVEKLLCSAWYDDHTEMFRYVPAHYPGLNEDTLPVIRLSA